MAFKKSVEENFHLDPYNRVEEKGGITPLREELKDAMLAAGVTYDEIKIIESWRFIQYGKIICYKKEGVLSGRIDIVTTY